MQLTERKFQVEFPGAVGLPPQRPVQPRELQVSDRSGTVDLQPNNQVNDQVYEVSDWKVVGQLQRPE